MVQDKNKLNEVGLEPDKPKGHIRGIWALTLILAFAIIIAGGVYFILWYAPWGESSYWHRKGSVDETKDWQTYTDKTNNASFKYPKDWKNKDYGSIGVLFYQQDQENQFKDKEWEGLALLPGGIGYHVETGTILNTLAKFESEHGSCIAEDKKIAGLDGKYVECPPARGLTKTLWYYLVENTGKTYYLFTVEESNKTILGKMAGTIKFSGATASPTTSQSNVRYKTYTNSIDKFSFEYPENLYILPEGFTGEHQGSGTVKILKKSDDNLLIPTKIEVTSQRMSPQTTDIRAAYKAIYTSDLVDDSIRRITDTTIAGVPALKETYTDAEDMGYYFVSGEYFYSITAHMSRVDEDTSPLADKDNKSAFDHIVSSFKFL